MARLNAIYVLFLVIFVAQAFSLSLDTDLKRWKIVYDSFDKPTQAPIATARPERLSKLVQESFQDWEQFKKVHGKQFSSHQQETEKMLAFLSAKQYVEQHNEAYEKGQASFKLDINRMADMTDAEYEKMNGYRPAIKHLVGNVQSRPSFLPLMNVKVPDSLDWREHDFVTDVKDQDYPGSCGSCWAFSATGALEGQHKRASGKLVSLSEQNLIDCSKRYGNYGCDGGLPALAFKYVKDNDGIDTEAAYPYLGTDDNPCKFDKSKVGAVDHGFVNLPQGDEEQLKVALATQGPISVAIDAHHKSFMHYKEGVYYDPECKNGPRDLTHAVLLVGYGTDPVHGDYWLIKNSWNTTWGEKGYIKMARNRDNHCGIATDASYPLI